MDRISKTFDRIKAENRAAFVAYLCSCDPDLDTSEKICRAAIENGTDIIELGIPFSDPLADGPTNQAASQRALDNGATMATTLELVRRIRAFSDAPVSFYTYINVLMAHGGIDNTVRMAKEAGVDAMLVLDLPPEEAGEVLDIFKKHDMKTVFIVAPTTSDERLPLIAKSTNGFIYYVSREGVTGVRNTLAENIVGNLERIKAVAQTPVVVGFGISTPEHVAQLAPHADGIVVGSALVNTIAANLDHPEKIPEILGNTVSSLVKGLSRK